MDCVLCFEHAEERTMSDIAASADEENSHMHLLELYVPFFDVNSIQSQSSCLLCLSCSTSLRDFHKFYQKILKNFLNRLDAAEEEEANAAPKSENAGKVYEILTIERLDPQTVEGTSASDVKSEAAGTRNDQEDSELQQKSSKPPSKQVTAFLDDFTKKSSIFASFIESACDICGDPQTSLKSALDHHKKAHNQLGYVTCCSRKFHKKSLLVAHLQLHENPSLFACRFCRKNLTSAHNLRMHLRLLHEPPQASLACDICSRCFRTKYRLAAHMKDTHVKLAASETLQCSDCRKRFKSLQRLERHLATHTGSATWCCEQCGKSLKTQASLRDHVAAAHSASPRLKCHLCSHFLKNRLSLRKHLNRHRQMAENIACGVCGKACTTRASLRSHMRMKHLLERNIACNFCEKKFKQAIDRDEHEGTHTGVHPYQCPWCPASFKFGANFRAHRKNSHPVEYERVKPEWLRGE